MGNWLRSRGGSVCRRRASRYLRHHRVPQRPANCDRRAPHDPVHHPPVDPIALHHLGVRHPRLLHAAHDPRRSRRPDARPRVHAGGGRGAAHKLGLDQPLHVQYVRWFGNVLRGDLGGSIASGETVAEAIASGLPKTLSLAALSFLIALIIAVPAGIIAALRRNSAFRLRRQRRRLCRRQHAELLVRHHPDPHLCRAPTLAPGHRLLRDRGGRRLASGSSD